MIAALLVLSQLTPCDLPPPSDPEARGLAIARAADRADSGWKAEVSTATMTIETQSGGRQHRTFRLTLLEAGSAKNGERSLIELLAPARHVGTRVLTIATSDDAEEVFVRFPRHGRTRRIVGRKRTGRFLGSELTFEDLGSRKHTRYQHRWLRDERLDGIECHVVETIPRDEDTGYAAILLWREVGLYRLHKVQWLGKAGRRPVKTARFDDWAQIDGFFRPKRQVVRNAQTLRRTTVIFKNRRVNADVPAEWLTRGGLSR